MTKLTVKANVKIHNRFDVFLTDKISGETRQVAQAENILLDQFWTYFTVGWGSYIWLGSGDGVLDPARTTLFSSELSRSATFNSVDFSLAEEGIFSLRRYIVLSELEHNGTEFKEIGLGTSTRPHTHALLQGMNGNPVTIEKISTEILTVYGTTYAYIDPSLWQEKKVIIPFYAHTGSESAESEFLLLFLGKSSSAMSSVSTYMCISDTMLCSLVVNGWQTVPVYKSSPSTPTWSAVNKKISTPTVRWGTTEANGKAIRSVGIINTNNVDYAEPKILVGLAGNPDWPGVLIEGESVGVGDGSETDFVTDFGFIHSGWIVYVDGVEQVSGVSVDEGLPIVNRLEYFVNPIKVDNWNLIPGFANYKNVQKDGAECILENPYYSDIGIDLINLGYLTLYCSNDLSTWTLVSDRKSASSTDVDTSAYRGYRYWKVVKPSDSSQTWTYFTNFRSSQLTTARNIHFDEAPAEDAVITIDYTTDDCPKDSNYVIDASLEILLAEYTEE